MSTFKHLHDFPMLLSPFSFMIRVNGHMTQNKQLLVMETSIQNNVVNMIIVITTIIIVDVVIIIIIIDNNITPSIPIRRRWFHLSPGKDKGLPDESIWGGPSWSPGLLDLLRVGGKFWKEAWMQSITGLGECSICQHRLLSCDSCTVAGRCKWIDQ